MNTAADVTTVRMYISSLNVPYFNTFYIIRNSLMMAILPTKHVAGIEFLHFCVNNSHTKCFITVRIYFLNNEPHHGECIACALYSCVMGLNFFPKACYTGRHFSSFPSYPTSGYVKEAVTTSVLKTFNTVRNF